MEEFKFNDDVDVIIVGTGVAASIMAKQLSNYKLEEGKFIPRTFSIDGETEDNAIKIVMLEAGLKHGVKLQGQEAYKTHNSYQNKFDMETAKVPNSPYPNLNVAPSPDVFDLVKGRGYLVQDGPMSFLSDAIRVGGGTTMHWLGSTPRMLPSDFQLKSKFKKAVDWPITHDDLKPYYDFAEYELGVAGKSIEAKENDDTLKNAYLSIGEVDQLKEINPHHFPMTEIPMSYSDIRVIEHLDVDNTKYNFDDLISNENVKLNINHTPQARNSFPNKAYNKSFKFQEIEKPVEKKSLNCEEEEDLDNPQCPMDPDLQIKYKLEVSDTTENPFTISGAMWDQYQGNRCEGNASCVPFCPAQAKYNALKTLKQALYKRNDKDVLVDNKFIQIEGQTIVYALEAEENGKIERIFIKQYNKDYIKDEHGNITNKECVKIEDKCIDTSNKIVVLACNAIENAKILLNSYYKGNQEKTVSNKSDQVGRNLMDHMVYLEWGYAKEPLYPFRGPGSTANISNFRDGDFRKDFAPFFGPIDNWGWGWPTFAPGSDLESLLKKGLIGKALKNTLGKLVERQLLFKWEVEQLPDPDNRITIDPSYRDEIGIPRPVISYNISNYEKKAIINARKLTKQLFDKMEVERHTEYQQGSINSFEDEDITYGFKGAGHIVGTHRIGKCPTTSVTNSYCRSWEHENLYLIGTGSMPTLGTSNPTLTMVALTLRATESVLTDLIRKKTKNETTAN